VVGAARFRDAYLFALSSDGASLLAVLDGDWAQRARGRWAERLWALEWVPENEFGHWDGVRMRSLRSRWPGFRTGRPDQASSSSPRL
jgi:hypothetical protein